MANILQVQNAVSDGKLVDLKLLLNSISDSICVSQYPSCVHIAFCLHFQKHLFSSAFM